MRTPEEYVAAHEAAGRRVDVGGAHTFVWSAGEGAPVVCIHGVPVSAFLWRKVLPAIAARGMRGVAFDLPGMCLAARPADFDYSWTGLGRFALETVDALGLERFHLVVHDIGGPAGFELAAAAPERVASLTILNTMIEATKFRKPWPMRPFEVPVLGEIWLHAMFDAAFLQLMYRVGVSDRRVAPPDEVLAHLRLLRRGDGGRAFLKVMRGFETTPEKEARYASAVGSDAYPVQAIWGRDDPALSLARYGAEVRRHVGDERFSTVPGKHFLQETAFEAIAEKVVRFARGAGPISEGT